MLSIWRRTKAGAWNVRGGVETLDKVPRKGFTEKSYWKKSYCNDLGWKIVCPSGCPQPSQLLTQTHNNLNSRRAWASLKRWLSNKTYMTSKQEESWEAIQPHPLSFSEETEAMVFQLISDSTQDLCICTVLCSSHSPLASSLKPSASKLFLSKLHHPSQMHLMLHICH